MNELRLFSTTKKSLLLGVSFSATAIKVVELHHQQGRYQLKNYAIHPLKSGEIVDDTFSDCEEIGHYLSNMIYPFNLSHPKAATGIAESSAITKLIDMSADLSDLDIEAQITIDAEQHIPYPLSEVSFDFEVVGVSPTDTEFIQVLLVASRTDQISQRVDALALAGIDACVVETELHAIERAFQLNCDSLPEYPKTVALVDIGHSRITLYIAEEGKFVYHLEQLFDSKQLTEVIQASDMLTDEEAINVMQPFIEHLTHYINHGLQLYLSSVDRSQASAEGYQVEHVVLCGDCAMLTGLPPALHAQLNLPVSVANPFSRMGIDPRIDNQQLSQDAPSLMAACGLALRRDMAQEIEIKSWRR